MDSFCFGMARSKNGNVSISIGVGVTLKRDELEKVVAEMQARIASLEARVAELEHQKQETPAEEATDWADPRIAEGYAMLSSILSTRKRFGSIG